MFLDEGSSEFIVEKNVIYGVAKAAIRFHKARALMVRNNLLYVAEGRDPFTFNACTRESMSFADIQILPMPKIRLLVPGRAGLALGCDGSTVWEEVPHATELEPACLTLESWVRLSTWPYGEDPRRWVVGKNGNEWENGHYALAIKGRNVGAYLNVGGGKENCFEAWIVEAPLELDRWHHLAMTYDDTTLTVYLDGEPIATRVIGRPRVPGGGPFTVGSRPDRFPTSRFRGAIDEVRLYDRAFSAAEIRARAREAADAASSHGLLLRLPFDKDPIPLPLPEWITEAGIEAKYRMCFGRFGTFR